MSEEFMINGELREDVGKGASRRLRHAGKVPAVLYGGGRDPRSLSLDHMELLRKTDNEAFFSHILTLKVGEESQECIVKDMQRHPSKPMIMHMDLQRIIAGEEIRMHVPLHFEGEKVAPGVKQQGGIISHHLIEVEVACLPKNLPEYISVDCSEMEMDQILHLTDLKLPDGVTLVAFTHGDIEEHDQAVVSIHPPRITVEETPEDEEAEVEAEGEAKAEEKKGDGDED